MPRSQLFSQVGAPETPQLNSSLLNLPAEIRNDIYERVFDYLAVGPHPRNPNYSQRDSTSKSILLVCKQTHAEAIQLFYRSIVFCFVFLPDRGFKSWIRKLGQARASLIEEIRYDGPHRGRKDWTGPLTGINGLKAAFVRCCLDDRREEGGLREGIVKVQLGFEGGLVWTRFPEKLYVTLLNNTVYVEALNLRFWICEPPGKLDSEFVSIQKL